MSPNRPPQAMHAMNPLGRFADRAADYVKYRPEYPAAAWDAVLAGLRAPDSLAAVDVGAGTGISARQLAERGLRVLAVEPNAEMRAAAGSHPGVEWREGRAEATGLPGHCADLVVCAQAFHWFRAEEALREFHRILRPGGRLALLWNSRDSRELFTRGYREALLEASGDHPAERREFDAGVIERQGLFGGMRLLTFEHAQALDQEGLIGRAASASYVPKTGAAFEALSTRLAALFERHRDGSGRVTLHYRTEVYLAERR